MKFRYDKNLTEFIALNGIRNRTKEITLNIFTREDNKFIYVGTLDKNNIANYVLLNMAIIDNISREHLTTIVEVLRALDFDIEFDNRETVEEILEEMYSEVNMQDFLYYGYNYYFSYALTHNGETEFKAPLVQYNQFNAVWLKKEAIEDAIRKLKNIQADFYSILKAEKTILKKLWE